MGYPSSTGPPIGANVPLKSVSMIPAVGSFDQLTPRLSSTSPSTLTPTVQASRPDLRKNANGFLK